MAKKDEKLSFALALGIMGALSMLAINYYPTITRALPFMNEHGNSLRFVMEDVYPIYTHAVWYKALLGPIFGFVDCFVFGYLLAYLYNWISAK
ncbi:hypothetical protein GF354_06375 [Candidatus Peregrinibacteria bacterium]|nr:hypothetical protein [Candidatus Peregrinibacteria bacterium]